MLSPPGLIDTKIFSDMNQERIDAKVQSTGWAGLAAVGT
jgi:hypothetical protein